MNVQMLWLEKLRRGRGAANGRGFFPRQGGGFGGDDDDFSRARKFNSDDLQLLLIALLIEAPRHGYELIRLLEARSNGFYVPSPGMVYPALTYLEEINYATSAIDGTRKSYSLTAQGRKHLEDNRERVDVLWAKLNFLGKKMGMVRRALAGQETDREDAGSHPVKELMEARLKLKHHLFALGAISTEEQLRIAKILERAFAEIVATPKVSEHN